MTITVVCCSPEKIRDKLCCKGGGSIKSIEIVDPPKPKPAEAEKKKEVDKPKPAAEPEKKKDPEKPKPTAEPAKPKPTAEPEKKKEPEKAKSDPPKKDADKPKAQPDKPKGNPAPPPIPVNPQATPAMAVPVGMCYVPPCYEGRPVGPGYDYGGPVLCYDGYYARPVYDSYGGARPCYGSRCDQYFSEENATGCTIM